MYGAGCMPMGCIVASHTCTVVSLLSAPAGSRYPLLSFRVSGYSIIIQQKFKSQACDMMAPDGIATPVYRLITVLTHGSFPPQFTKINDLSAMI